MQAAPCAPQPWVLPGAGMAPQLGVASHLGGGGRVGASLVPPALEPSPGEDELPPRRHHKSRGCN